jgi:hypothetical protein
MSTISFSQESQSILAAKWQDGKYAWFNNNGGKNVSGSPEFEQEGEVDVSFKKDDKGEVIEVIVNEKRYVADNVGKSAYVRYFRTTTDSGRSLFFVDDRIDVFILGTDEGELNARFIASISKKGVKKSFSKFMSHLEKTRSKVADEIALYEKNKSENTIVGKVQEIQKVEHVIVTKDGKPLKSGDKFTFGFITTFKDGKVIKTKNIGGLQDIKEFKYQISYPMSMFQYKYNVGTKLNDSIAPYCDYLLGEKVKISITTSDYFSKSLAYSDFAIENCTEDPSPLVAFFREAAQNYTSLNFIYGPGILNQEYFGKHEKFGFLLQSSAMDKDFEFENLKEDNCFIIGEKENKYYFLNLSGDLKSKQGYDEIRSLYEGNFSLVYNGIPLYCIKKDGKYGILDYKLNEILPFEYDEIVLAGKDRMVVTKDGKSTLVNSKTMSNISDTYNQLVPGFDLTNCMVELNGKFGYIDLDGKIIIEVKYDDLGFFTSNRMATARIGQKRFYINTSGGVALDEGYLEVGSFKWKNVKKKGKEETLYYASVTDKDGNKKLINQYGSTLTDEDFEGSDMPAVSSSSNSSSSSSSSKTKTSTKCTILNDLKPDQVSKYNDVRLVFDNSQIVSKSLSRGQSMEVDCDDVIVHAGVLGSTNSEKVRKLFETEGKCGQTIKLSDYW